MGVSVVIVAKKGEKYVYDCIDSIKAQSTKASETIVVSQEKINVNGIKNVVSKANRSKARNIGWKKAKSKIVLFAEADSIFGKNWINNIVSEFKKGADAVIDRRAVYKPKTFIQKCGDEFFSLRYSDYKPFCAQAYKKNVLEDTKGFDEKIEYSEDTDLGTRILKKGYKINLAEKAFQFHKGEPKSLMGVMKRSITFGKEKANTYFKKYPKQAPVFDSMMIILWFLLLPLVFVTLWSLVLFFLIDLMLFTIFIAKLLRQQKHYKLKMRYLVGIATMNYFKWFFTRIGFMYGKLRGGR